MRNVEDRAKAKWKVDLGGGIGYWENGCCDCEPKCTEILSRCIPLELVVMFTEQNDEH